MDVKDQYKNANNLSSRINLHEHFSVNKEGWFNWVFNQLDLENQTDILELGCGNGELWKQNQKKIPKGKKIILSDFSNGMLDSAIQNLMTTSNFLFEIIDAVKINKDSSSLDLIIANHLLYHIQDLDTCLFEIARVLKSGKKLYTTTMGQSHLVEISNVVKEFDNSINLSFSGHSKRFGIENGEKILKSYFTDVEFVRFEDYLFVTEVAPLIEFIMSTSSNVKEKITNSNLEKFREFLEGKIQKDGGIRITKDIGIFISTKSF